jgi:hypothetical protein
VAATSLTWKPAATPEEIQPVLQWIAQTAPTLDAIDARLDAAIKKPGPHVFAQTLSLATGVFGMARDLCAHYNAPSLQGEGWDGDGGGLACELTGSLTSRVTTKIWFRYLVPSWEADSARLVNEAITAKKSRLESGAEPDQRLQRKRSV